MYSSSTKCVSQRQIISRPQDWIISDLNLLFRPLSQPATFQHAILRLRRDSPLKDEEGLEWGGEGVVSREEEEEAYPWQRLRAPPSATGVDLKRRWGGEGRGRERGAQGIPEQTVTPIRMHLVMETLAIGVDSRGTS